MGSIIVTSGTLTPLETYSMELGIPFPHSLENSHVIHPDQIHVQIIGRGPQGVSLNCSYGNRQNPQYAPELGRTLVSLSKTVPSGMLVFFPSYNMMDTALQKWGGPTYYSSFSRGLANKMRKKLVRKWIFPQAQAAFALPRKLHSSHSIWEQLLSRKSILLEPRSSADLPFTISEYKRLLLEPSSGGCILMGVCRGKISEGIDFSGDMSRAVVITGIPFPPKHDPKVRLKQEFLEQARSAALAQSSQEGGFLRPSIQDGCVQQKLSGDSWYTQQAHRAVNQAIGRVIRSKQDYGAILLLDDRFSSRQNREGLSAWVRPHIKTNSGLENTLHQLSSFYREAPNFGVNTNKETTDLSAVHREAHKSASVPPIPKNFTPNFVSNKRTKCCHHNEEADPPTAHNAFVSGLNAFPKEPRSQIKQLVRKMRSNTALDSASKLQLFRSILQSILQFETIQDPPTTGDTRLYFLAFGLIGGEDEQAAKRMGVKLVVEGSPIGSHAQNHLEDADYIKVKNRLVPLLCGLWFPRAHEAIEERAILSAIHTIIDTMIKCPKTTWKETFNSLLKMIPARFKEETDALISERIAKEKMKQTKQQEKDRQGEHGMDMRPFVKPLNVYMQKNPPHSARK